MADIFAPGFDCQATYGLPCLLGGGHWDCMQPERKTADTLHVFLIIFFYIYSCYFPKRILELNTESKEVVKMQIQYYLSSGLHLGS